MSLYDAATLHGWGWLIGCWPTTSCSTTHGLRGTLAAGPTQAHAATKRIVRAQADHGTRGADERTAALTSHLFETQDSREAVQSFPAGRTGQGHFHR